MSILSNLVANCRPVGFRYEITKDWEFESSQGRFFFCYLLFLAIILRLYDLGRLRLFLQVQRIAFVRQHNDNFLTWVLHTQLFPNFQRYSQHLRERWIRRRKLMASQLFPSTVLSLEGGKSETYNSDTYIEQHTAPNFQSEREDLLFIEDGMCKQQMQRRMTTCHEQTGGMIGGKG